MIANREQTKYEAKEFFRLHSDDQQRLESLAAELGVKKAKIVRFALLQYLDNATA